MKNRMISFKYIILFIIFILFLSGCEIDSFLYNPHRDNPNDPWSDNYDVLHVLANPNNIYNVPIDTNIVITFAKPVNPDNNWYIIIDVLSVVLNKNFIIKQNSSEITWNADYSVLTIDPADDFPKSAIVDVYLNDFISMDGENNIVSLNYNRQYPYNLFRFYTIEYQLCNMELNIDNNEQNVPVNSDIVLVFDRLMNPNYDFEIRINIFYNVSDSIYFILKKSSPEISWNNDNTILTLNPAVDLPASATAKLTWNGFESLDGDYFVEEGEINFYTN